MNASRSLRALSLILVLSIMLLPVPSAQAAQGDTTRVSVASDGTQGNSYSYNPSTSADGRFVAFFSSATNLVSGDTNGTYDVFVHDRQTGATSRVSVASDGTQGDNWSQSPSISADGRYVAFESHASNLVSGDTNGTTDVFVHDRQTGATSRVSVATGGAQGNGGSTYPSISADGRYVAFSSLATNLVSGDTNGWIDVFVHDWQTGETSRASVASDGTQGNGDSSYESPSISSDARFVAFESLASNLVNGDMNGKWDVFVHDRQTGETIRVSVASNGIEGDNASISPSISADGRYVAFETAATLTGGDYNGARDIFVHDRQTGETSLVSVATGGTQGNHYSSGASISSDGRHVAFTSYATNLVSGDTNGIEDIFVHDRVSGVTSRVSVASGGEEGNSKSTLPSISADGRFVAFESLAMNLVSGDTNGAGDIFVHDQGVPTSLVAISGNAGTGGVTLGYMDGVAKSVLSDSAGDYSIHVPSGWSGTVTPSKAGYTFTPAQREYLDVTTDQTGQDYIAKTSLSFRPAAAYDGWILESTETSTIGGTLNVTATTFNLGDDAADRQYRAVLSFNTAGLPDNAVLTKATLKIKQQGLPVGTNPFTTHMGLKVDIRKPYFGTTVGLAISDFQAWASLSGAATFNKTPATGAWYSAILSSTAFPYINRTGTTQFRLHFLKDDNDDMSADYVKFYSGNTLTISYRPVLVVQYYIP